MKQNYIVRFNFQLQLEFKKIRIIGASKKTQFYRPIC